MSDSKRVAPEQLDASEREVWERIDGAMMDDSAWQVLAENLLRTISSLRLSRLERGPVDVEGRRRLEKERDDARREFCERGDENQELMRRLAQAEAKLPTDSKLTEVAREIAEYCDNWKASALDVTRLLRKHLGTAAKEGKYMWTEIPALYEVAKKLCHDSGLPWTDPRTGITHKPPRRAKRRKKAKRARTAKGER